MGRGSVDFSSKSLIAIVLVGNPKKNRSWEAVSGLLKS